MNPQIVPNEHEELLALARRLVWFMPPEQALLNRPLIAAHFFEFGTLEDWYLLKQHWGRDEMKTLLEKTPPGIVRPRSWHFWNVALRPDQPPLPLPERKLPE